MAERITGPRTRQSHTERLMLLSLLVEIRLDGELVTAPFTLVVAE